MDIIEKRKQYYIDNRNKLLQQSKQYYLDNKEVRQKYNREYWELNKYKYLKARSENNEYKMNHRIYNEKYRGKSKYIYKDNYFQPSQKDITVIFKFSFYST